MLDQATQLTHDTLIQRLGAARRSGVWWTTFYGAQARRSYLELMAEFGRPPTEEALGRLQTPRSALVVAWCISVAPPGCEH